MIFAGLSHNQASIMLFLTRLNLVARRVLSRTNYTETIINISVPSISNVSKENKRVGIWLCSVCGITASTILLGGVTRLTKSGLSMVDWHPFHEFPPKNDKWFEEFEKYKQYPEFKKRNSDITLEEFKWIWYMEYAHRTMGRVIGLSFFLPAAYFGAKSYFKGRVKYVIGLLGGLILFQGGLGWYMVKSGLVDNPYDPEPKVSHLRLASHLGTAFLFHSVCLITALHHLLPPQVNQKAVHLLKFKRFAYAVTGAVFITAVSGALVAGMEAGLTYNSWPMMADRWIPTDLLTKTPVWTNFFQNSTTVQFDHRWLGQLTFLGITGLWLYSKRLHLPPRARIGSNLVMMLACFQLSLGITTLLLYVPKHLAAAHQSGALALLSSSLWLSNELKLVKRVIH